MGVVVTKFPVGMENIICQNVLSSRDNYVVSDDFSLKVSIGDLVMLLSGSDYRKLKRIIASDNHDLIARIEGAVKEQAATTGIHHRLSKTVRSLIRSSNA
jgi:hypothetical protein